MSYSFNVTAKDKDAAKDAVAEKLNEILGTQPEHARDKDAAFNAVSAYLGLLDVTGDPISVSVSGSIGWSGVKDDKSDRKYTGAGLNVSVRTYKSA